MRRSNPLGPDDSRTNKILLPKRHHSMYYSTSASTSFADGAKERGRKGLRGHEAGAMSAEKENKHPYHHVPEVAASQFSRTTTRTTIHDGVDNKSLMHKLSRRTIRFRLDDPDVIQGRVADESKAKSLKRSQSQRDRGYDRAQCQHLPTLDVAADGHHREDMPAQRHTFVADFQAMAGQHEKENSARRLSGGTCPRDSSDLPEMAVYTEMGRQYSHESHDATKDHIPVDWSQSDEIRARTQAAEQSRLRKSESRWTLKNRFGGATLKNKTTSEAHAKSPTKESSPWSPISLRPSKSAFFARFKR